MSLLTAKQVAERLQLSRPVVSRLCSSGQLAHHRIGRISEQDLEAFLTQTQQGEPQHRTTLAIVVGPGRKRTKKQTAAPE